MTMNSIRVVYASTLSRATKKPVSAYNRRARLIFRRPAIASIDHTRRRLLAGLAAGSAIASAGLARTAFAVDKPTPPAGVTPFDLARDESFWREVGTYYDRTEGIVNLEHGYWGKMARPVQSAYLDAIRMVNTQNSFYARKDFDADEAEATRRIAESLGAHAEEIVITRNATEAAHNLIRQYRGLGKGELPIDHGIDPTGRQQFEK